MTDTYTLGPCPCPSPTLTKVETGDRTLLRTGGDPTSEGRPPTPPSRRPVGPVLGTVPSISPLVRSEGRPGWT